MIYATGWAREGVDDENGPKRRFWRRLGPRYVFFFSLLYFVVLTIVLMNIWSLINELRNREKDGKKL